MRAGDPAAWFADVAAARRRCFWLDGGGSRDWSGRRSIVGTLTDDDVSLTYDAARREVRRHVGGASEVVGDDLFAALEAEVAAGPPDGQWFGYAGYACRPDLPALVAPAAGPEDDRVPDAVWMRPSSVRMFEHPVGVPGAPPGGPRLTDEPVPGWYADAFAEVQEQLRAGNTYEVNLTHRLDVASGVDPAAAYLRLRATNPAPYAGFLQHDVEGHRAWLLSSSPERYATVRRGEHGGRVLETKPIKGTAPRGATPADDEAARAFLLSDVKTRAENLMIVDLLRNDLATVCRPGTVQVPALMQVETYAGVHQLVSTVRGELDEGITTVAALRALFPAGSMTGAPKRRTMEVVAAVERTPRGVYSGAFGWVSADGRADLGVVIRAAVTAGDGRWQVGTGGGITVRSEVAAEWAETRWKAARVLAALADPSPL